MKIRTPFRQPVFRGQAGYPHISRLYDKTQGPKTIEKGPQLLFRGFDLFAKIAPQDPLLALFFHLQAGTAQLHDEIGHRIGGLISDPHFDQHPGRPGHLHIPRASLSLLKKFLPGSGG